MIHKTLDERYYIMKKIGKGGLGEVYLAKDLRIKKLKAIKKIDLNENKKEIDIQLKLEHPAIAQISDFFTIDEWKFFVMDYFSGLTLKQILINNGIQKEKTVIGWALQICDILHYLHEEKSPPVIYCDIKPENFILTKENRLKILDFGSAIFYGDKSEYYYGTKGYAAPEQYPAATEKVDSQTDIYGLGCLISVLLTGKITNNIKSINPLLSKEIEKIVKKARKKNKIDRYKNIDQVNYDLQKLSFLLS